MLELSLGRTTNFTVTLNALPNVEFFVTDLFIPGINLAETTLQHKGSQVFKPDTSITYDPLSVGFNVDERFEAYFECFDWFHSYADPDGPRIDSASPDESASLLLTILDNNKNPIIIIEYVNVWPTNLGQVLYNVQDPSNAPLTCDLTLRYDTIKYERIDGPLPTQLP